MLPGKITQAVFTIIDTSGPTTISTHTLTVSNVQHPWNMAFWEGRKELSIGGVKRKKNIIRGFDAKLSFDWEDVRNQETDIIDFINDLKVAADNDYRIQFNVFGDTNKLHLVPEDAVYSQNYTNQVTRRTETSISFEIEQLQDDISYQ